MSTSSASPQPRTAKPAARKPAKRVPSVHAREREDEILNAAAEIFQQRGYGATSVNDIASAVGMLKGSLYYYFTSKEDLLYRITRAIHENAMANMAEAEGTPGSAEERLRVLTLGHMRALPERRTWISVFYTEYKHLTGRRRTEIFAVRRRYEAFVQDLIRQGQAANSFCPDRDPVVMANAVLTLLNSPTLWSADIDIEKVSAAYSEFALAGLRCAHDHTVRPRRTRAASGAGPTAAVTARLRSSAAAAKRPSDG